MGLSGVFHILPFVKHGGGSQPLKGKMIAICVLAHTSIELNLDLFEAQVLPLAPLEAHLRLRIVLFGSLKNGLILE
jgi:hypothetical protein